MYGGVVGVAAGGDGGVGAPGAPSHIVDEAKMNIRESRGHAALEREQDEALRSTISRYSEGAVRDASATWGVIGAAGDRPVGAAPEAPPNFVAQPSPLLALSWERSGESVADAAAQTLGAHDCHRQRSAMESTAPGGPLRRLPSAR